MGAIKEYYHDEIEQGFRRHPMLEILYKCPQCGGRCNKNEEFCSEKCFNNYWDNN